MQAASAAFPRFSGRARGRTLYPCASRAGPCCSRAARSVGAEDGAGYACKRRCDLLPRTSARATTTRVVGDWRPVQIAVEAPQELREVGSAQLDVSTG